MFILNLVLGIPAAFLLLGLSSQLKSSVVASETNRLLLESAIASVTTNIQQITYNVEGWNAVISANPNLNCLKRYQSNSPDPSLPMCSHGQQGTMAMVWPDGTSYIDASGQKFDFDGAVCTRMECPWSVRLHYRIDCDSPCTDPIVYLRSEFSSSLNFFNKFVFNMAKRDFEVRVGPYAMNAWSLCASRNAVYLPTGFNGFTPDRQGCVDVSAFNGDMGPMGPAGPPGELTLANRRSRLTHCIRKTSAPFSGNLADPISSGLLKSGLKLHLYPSRGHCTGVAFRLLAVGTKGTRFQLPCRASSGNAQCFTFANQSFHDMKRLTNPVFEVAAEDLKSLIDNDEDLARIEYDWAYNSGGPGATCFYSVYNKESYGTVLVVETALDSKGPNPSVCASSMPYVIKSDLFE